MHLLNIQWRDFSFLNFKNFLQIIRLSACSVTLLCELLTDYVRLANSNHCQLQTLLKVVLSCLLLIYFHCYLCFLLAAVFINPCAICSLVLFSKMISSFFLSLSWILSQLLNFYNIGLLFFFHIFYYPLDFLACSEIH